MCRGHEEVDVAGEGRLLSTEAKSIHQQMTVVPDHAKYKCL